MQRVKQMDSLRFIMVWVIIISHFSFLESSPVGVLYSRYIDNPTIAVDYFLMLSGFGMYNKFKNSANNMIDSGKYGLIFALEKMKKIYLPYLICLVICVPHVISDRCSKYGLKIAILMTLFNFVVCLTLTQSLFGTSTIAHAINPVCWFISALFVCYMLSPALYHLIQRINKKKACILAFGGGYGRYLAVDSGF